VRALPKIVEKCGVVGVSSIAKDSVIEHVYKAFFTIQHDRGVGVWHRPAQDRALLGLPHGVPVFQKPQAGALGGVLEEVG